MIAHTTWPSMTDYGTDTSSPGFLDYNPYWFVTSVSGDYPDDSWLFEAWQKKYQAQWILREFPWKIEPPELMAVTRKAVKWKMLRCNRKGIGLRIRRDN